MKYSVILLYAIVGFALVMLPVAVKAAGSTTGSTDISVTVLPTAPPSQPTIVSPSTASTTTTTASSISVSGLAEHDSTVKAYVNSQFRGQVTANYSGAFSLSVPLSLGQNNIYVTATNILGTSPQSDTATVIRNQESTQSSDTGTTSQPAPSNTGADNIPTDNPPADEPQESAAPPAPSVTSVKDNQVIQGDEVQIAGYADPNVWVEIEVNGQIVARVLSDEQGYYSATVALKEGRNNINVYAIKDGKGGAVKSLTLYAKTDVEKVDEQVSSANTILEIVGIALLILTLILTLIAVFHHRFHHSENQQT